MSGASAATRSTTSRQNSTGIAASNSSCGERRLRRATGCRARLARQRVPQALDVALREHHRGVEADDREAPRDLEDLPDDRLPDVGAQVVELRGVVPGEARAVVAVVDVARLAAPAVDALEHDRGVRRVPVVVLELDADALVGGQVGPVVGVRRERRVVGLEMNHSGCSITQRESMPMWLGTMSAASRMPRAPARSRRSRQAVLAAQVVRDPVVHERVGGRHRVRVAAAAA